MNTPDLTKLRRFGLLIALILITYSVAGLDIDAPAKVNVMGLPLIIRRPDFLPVGLVLASIYCIIKYIYYGYLVQTSPTQARFLLKKGSPVHVSTIGISLEEFTNEISNEVDRYFPGIGKIEASYTTSQGTQCSVKVIVPKIVWAFSLLEDIDYALPVIANALAIAIWTIIMR
jgi:hypothetical protein